jgi:hypothetical protein
MVLTKVLLSHILRWLPTTDHRSLVLLQFCCRTWRDMDLWEPAWRQRCQAQWPGTNLSACPTWQSAYRLQYTTQQRGHCVLWTRRYRVPEPLDPRTTVLRVDGPWIRMVDLSVDDGPCRTLWMIRIHTGESPSSTPLVVSHPIGADAYGDMVVDSEGVVMVVGPNRLCRFAWVGEHKKEEWTIEPYGVEHVHHLMLTTVHGSESVLAIWVGSQERHCRYEGATLAQTIPVIHANESLRVDWNHRRWIGYAPNCFVRVLTFEGETISCVSLVKTPPPSLSSGLLYGFFLQNGNYWVDTASGRVYAASYPESFHAKRTRYATSDACRVVEDEWRTPRVAIVRPGATKAVLWNLDRGSGDAEMVAGDQHRLCVLYRDGHIQMAGFSPLQCAVCAHFTTTCCARCQRVAYCGKSCQRADWHRHKADECARRELWAVTVPLREVERPRMSDIRRFTTPEARRVYNHLFASE